MASKKRMLIRLDILKKAKVLKDLGVPIEAIKRSLDIVMTSKTLADLIHYYSSSFMNLEKNNSLNPEWLEANGEIIQTAPDNYRYIGRFPGGYWTKL